VSLLLTNPWSSSIAHSPHPTYSFRPIHERGERGGGRERGGRRRDSAKKRADERGKDKKAEGGSEGWRRIGKEMMKKERKGRVWKEREKGGEERECMGKEREGVGEERERRMWKEREEGVGKEEEEVWAERGREGR
jgi:hypothetical protein